MTFRDRVDAGRRLAKLVADLQLDNPVVLGLPRGGVVVAEPVAAALGAPLDVLVVRKIGAPGHPELAVGALAEGGEPVFEERVLRRLGLVPADVAATVERERAELARRVRVYRGDRALPSLAGRSPVVVDDGLATGATARAALTAVRAAGAARVVLAVPVAPPDAALAMRAYADDVVVVEMPAHFGAVSEVYEDFRQTTDEEVLAALARSR